MSTSFDPYDWASFYFGKMGRDEAARLLSETGVAIGTFLLRDSSRPGDYSLSVRESDEENKVRHYLIEEKLGENGVKQVKIADHDFMDIPTLLNHFKIHILDKTSLTIPYRKGQIEQVVGLYRFEGERDTDLPFEIGETLEIIGKPEEGWWQARNALNATGLVPAIYVRPIDENGDRQLKGHSQSSIGSSVGDERFSGVSTNSDPIEDRYEPPLPAVAKAIYDRQPNAYDRTQLKLKKGQLVRITKKLTNGMYEGESDGRVGIVPFTSGEESCISASPTTVVECSDPNDWELLAGCDCTGECSAEQNCACLLGAEDNYSSDGILLEKASGAPILECHDECLCAQCEQPCRNRVLQRGVQVALEIFECTGHKGYGVRAVREIPKGTFICEYAGEILNKDEVERRATSAHDHNYTMTIREHSDGGVVTTFVDPRHRGNLARFINHACEPNLSIVIVRIGYTVPHVGLFSNSQTDLNNQQVSAMTPEDNYSSDGILLEKASGAPILECHDECLCAQREQPCRNRILQRGVQVALEIFECTGHKGYGVRAVREIPKGTFICEYAGEVLNKDEVERRATSTHDHNYTMTIREHSEGGVVTTFVDPRHRGNLARFINHACEPNLSIVIVRTGYTVPHVGLFSNRTIRAGEEICYDYGISTLSLESGKQCLCGFPSCRKFLPMSATASE
nr:SH2 motif and Src homology-3 and Variant SH3 and Pre-SET zinc-binding region and SET domain containing protein [Haemonchus contortus]